MIISKNRSHKSLTIKDLQLRGGGREAVSPWGRVTYDIKKRPAGGRARKNPTGRAVSYEVTEKVS